MGYLIFFLLTMVVISVIPSLVQVIFIIWIGSMIINLFRPRKPRRGPFDQYQDPYQGQDRQESQRTRPSSNGDIIDVEFTQRDASDE